MAFNYGYPATYQFPYIQPQQFQQAMPQATPPATYQPSPAIIWVNNAAEVDAYLLAPNNAVTLWSRTEPVVYLKKSDASGRTTTQTFDLVERKEGPSDASVAPGVDLSTLVTRSELEAIQKRLDEMSGDLYGIAGKKRTVKKEEAAG